MSVRYQELTNKGLTPNRLERGRGWVEAENDCRIHVRIQGEGVPLLAMGGLGSGAFTTARIAKLFAERYMLISYDRRGTFRSIDPRPQNFDIAQQCRDVQSILAAYGLTSVTVLATCSAASIAMELQASYPELVNAMIIHDPMTVNVLPDAEAETCKLLKYGRITQERNADEAVATFLSDFELPYPDDFRRVAKREGWKIVEELSPCVIYRPKSEKLRLHRNRLVMASGQQCVDRGYSFAHAARVLSEQIGCRFVVLPGNHTGYFNEPAIFAEAIFDLIEKLTAA